MQRQGRGQKTAAWRTVQRANCKTGADRGCNAVIPDVKEMPSARDGVDEESEEAAQTTT